MKVSSSVLCMVALAGTSRSSAFAPVLASPFSLKLGKKQSALYDANPVSPFVESDISAVTADPERTSKNKLVANSLSPTLLFSSDIRVASSVFFGCLMTFTLNNYLVAVGPVRASSIVGMIATMVLPERLAVAAFCGAFAGMARESVIPGIFASAVLGLLCALLMTVFDRNKILVGVGGRLGFIAQLACTSQVLISSLISVPPAGAKIVGAYPSPRILMAQIVPTCIFTALGALLMSAWKESWTMLSKKAGGTETAGGRILSRFSTSVAAVSATGLAMSLFPGSVSGPAFCGSIIGMSSPVKIETYGGLLGASLMGGVSQVLMAGLLLGGWGGKLGTSSLVGVLLYRRIRAFFTTWTKTLTEPEYSAEARKQA